MKTYKICLGKDGIIVKTNQNVNKMRKESQNGVKNKQRLKKFDHLIGHSETDLSLLKAEKRNEDDQRLKKISYALKRSKADSRKSLRRYIEKRWIKATTMLLFYIIFLGATLSTPIIINHFGVKSQNQTEKERFITQTVCQKKYF